MLIADAKTDAKMDALANAAREIAQLKAQIAQLEKTVDGLLAQRLAGQDGPLADVVTADPVGDEHTAWDTEPGPQDIADDAEATAMSAEALHDDFVWPTDGDEVASHDEMRLVATNDAIIFGDVQTAGDSEAQDQPLKLIHGSLPDAVRNLICRPAPEALTSNDDLTLIKGVSAEVGLELAARNLNSFDAIAELDPETIATLKSEVSGAETLHRNGWIEQAAILRKGELTKYAQDRVKGEEPACEAETATDDVIDAAGAEGPVAIETTPEREPLTCTDAGTCQNACAACTSTDHEANEAWPTKLVTDPGDGSSVALSRDADELPRTIQISVEDCELLKSSAAPTSFLPMGAKDAGFAIQKIAHTPPPQPRDHGHGRALAVSLVASGVIVLGATLFGGLKLDATVSKLLHADVCKVTGLTAFPETCKIASSKLL